MAYEHRSSAPLDVVCIGGGTGLSALLGGIKQYLTSNPAQPRINVHRLTAIVTVSDDGGSSGQLIHEFDVLPPGDIRNCLVSLADAGDTLSQLSQHRFDTRGPLCGHSVGNLLLVALTDIYGSFPRAIQEASRVLAVRGSILPVTTERTVLCAELEDGSVVCGESEIPARANRSPVRRVFLRHQHQGDGAPVDRQVHALPEAVKAIEKADTILMGPGSLYTSVLPNVAVPAIADALERSSALKIYVCNVMTEPGETDGYSVSDHVAAIRRHVDVDLDYIVVNNGEVAPDLQKRDADNAGPASAQAQVLYDPQVDSIPPTLIWADSLIREVPVGAGEATLRVVRHDPLKTAQSLMQLLESVVAGEHHETPDVKPRVALRPAPFLYAQHATKWQ